MFKSIAILALIFSSLGCVSTHTGSMSQSDLAENPMVVSVDNQIALSDKYYLFLEYTFENKSADWLDVKVSALGFAGSDTEILVNDRLSSWIEGAELKLKKEQHNTAVILGSVAAVGGIAGAMSSDGNIQVAGFGVMAGAGVAATVNDVTNARRRAGSGQKGLNQTVEVPKNHVFAPFKVAPGSYVKRWVVVKRPSDFKNYTKNSLMMTELTQNKNKALFKTKL